MSDNLQGRRPRTRRQIDLEQGYEVRYWTRQLGCSAEELHTAVGKVGHSSAAIERALKKKITRRARRYFPG